MNGYDREVSRTIPSAGAETLGVTDILLLFSSAFFAWNMGSHYAGSVAGTAYGSKALPMSWLLVITAMFTVVGSGVGSLGVVGTYSALLRGATGLDIAAAQMAAAIVTAVATFLRLPTSTIQIYAFSTVGVALERGLPFHGALFGAIVVGWLCGPLAAFALSFGFTKISGGLRLRDHEVTRWLLLITVAYSAFVLGSNDVSNAAASVVGVGLIGPRWAALLGGSLMAVGVLTWGRGTIERIGRDIVPLEIPSALTAQLSKAVSLTVVNALGYNASINQSIVGGLIGTGIAKNGRDVNWTVLRNIVLNWTLSPLLGTAAAIVAVMLFRTIPGT